MTELKIADIMTPRLHCIAPDCPIERASRMMADKQVSCLVVVAADRHPLGIITERDVVRLLHDRVAGTQKVATVMSAPY